MVWARSSTNATERLLIISQILRQPGFHRAVGRIHREIDERQNGRLPHDPLAPGEATGTTVNATSATGFDANELTAIADPNKPKREGFLRHFISEIRNQASGRPTDLDKPFEEVQSSATGQYISRSATAKPSSKPRSDDEFRQEMAKKYPNLFEDTKK